MSEIARILTQHGFHTVVDWGTRFPTQVTGRMSKDGEWFYYRERSGAASMEIYPPDRYPFAPEGSNSIAGFDSQEFGNEPELVWGYEVDTPDEPTDHVELTVTMISRFYELWKLGTPPNYSG